MSFPMLGRTIDERFLNRRLRATSLAGIIGGVFASCLFTYRFYVSHVWSWDLLAVAVTIVTVKMAVMIWYWLTD